MGGLLRRLAELAGLTGRGEGACPKARVSGARSPHSLFDRCPAMELSCSSTARSASTTTRAPSSVIRRDTRRRSLSSWRRSTRPRVTSPSMMAVMDGGRTARRSASPDAASFPSARMASTRYWGSVRSTWCQGDLDRLGQPGCDPADARHGDVDALIDGRGRRRDGRDGRGTHGHFFDHHTVRWSNYVQAQIRERGSGGA